MRIAIVLLVSFFFVLGCEDSPDPSPMKDFRNIDVVTGLQLTDANGQPLGLWRSPNDNSAGIFVYPNPALDIISVGTSGSISPQRLIAEVHLVPAECLSDSTSTIAEDSKSITYSWLQIVEASTQDITLDTPSANLQLNFSDRPAGFYRLFIRDTENVVYRHNIYIDPTASNLSISDLDSACEG